MDHARFDDLTRSLARRQSRRTTLARLGQATAAAVVTGLGTKGAVGAAPILPCAEEDCRCQTGVLGSCAPGLVCCADNPNRPGGSGTCTPPSQCFGGLCNGDAVACPATCSWGTNCVDCCSGYCGTNGLCGPGPCRSVGCQCLTGTLAPCDEGLACCPTVAGLPGGPGICTPRGICN